MIVQPIPYPGGGFMLSDSTSDGSRHTHTGDFWEGYIVQAAESGTITKMHVKGSPDGPDSVNYRLVIYEAASATDTAGPKLGETGVANSLLQDEEKSLDLLAPVSITAGLFYAIGIHKQATMDTARRSGTGGLGFFDAWGDGALATAPTGFNNGGAPAIWATG